MLKSLALMGLLYLTIPRQVVAQVVDFDEVVAPPEAKPRDFEDYLAQLAWVNTQELAITDVERAIAEKEVLLAKKDWMDDVSFSFNLNEVSLENILDDNKSDNIVINPLYQFTAGVRLSTFFRNKHQREIAEKKVDLVNLDANQKKLRIRQLVLARYNRLLLAEEILKVRVEAEDNAMINNEYAAEKFKKGQLELDELIRAQESYANSMEARIAAQTDIELLILEIEELIGVDWEVALRYKERMK